MWRGQFLSQVIQQRGFRRGAELGVKTGRTLFHLLDHNPELEMLGVDLWGNVSDNAVESYADWPMDQIEKDVRAKAMHYSDRLRLLKMDTSVASILIPDASLDFVFIDADHSYNGVSLDICNWQPKVSQGGIVFGHDINWPSVKRAVEENFDNNYQTGPDNIWWTQTD